MKKLKAYIAINPTKFDTRYKRTVWFDAVSGFEIDHKQTLFKTMADAKSYIENRKDWIVVPCTITYSLPITDDKV